MVKFTPFLRASNYMQIKFECVCTPPWCLDEGGGADTLKFNLHIIGPTKKGCEFNQKRCEFKILHEILRLRINCIRLKNIFYRYTLKWISWPIEKQCTTFFFFFTFLKSRPLCDQTNKGVPVPSLPHFTDNNTTIHLFIPMLIIIMSFTFRMFECIEFSPFGPRIYIYIYIYGKGGTTFAKGDGIIKVRCYWELFG